MKKKRDYKVINFGFSTKREYDKFHKEAVSYIGFDNRTTDCLYIRECIKNDKLKSSNTNMRKRIKDFVNNQELTNVLTRATENENQKKYYKELAENEVKIWVV